MVAEAMKLHQSKEEEEDDEEERVDLRYTTYIHHTCYCMYSM